MATIQVPPTMSAVAILGANDIFDGDEYREDGFVYVKGIKTRRWFRPARYDPQLRVWAGYDDIKLLPEIEARYHRCKNKAVQYFKVSFQQMLELKPNGTCTTPNEKEYYKVWKFEKEPAMGWVYSFDWRTTEEKKPWRTNIGDEIERISKQRDTWGRRAGIYGAELEHLLRKATRELLGAPGDECVGVISVNGREYFYHNHYGGSEWQWKKLVWPGENTIRVEL